MDTSSSDNETLIISCNNDNILVYLNIENNSTYVNFFKFRQHLEYELTDIIDILVKSALETSKIKYCVVGGKALNMMTKPTFLSKSFDFDIHVENQNDLWILQEEISHNINLILKQEYRKLPRYLIFLALKKMGLVRDDLLAYYMNERLFFDGQRFRDDQYGMGMHGQPGVFLKFKFNKSGLFRLNGYNLHLNNTKNDSAINSSRGFSNDIISQDDLYYLMSDINQSEEYHIFYYPIVDIDVDKHLNFDVEIFKTTKPYDSIYKYNNIYYSSYILSLYNLIKYIGFNSYKTEKNYNKLKLLLLNPSSSLYSFYNYYTKEQLKLDVQNLLKQLKNNFITNLNKDILKNNEIRLKVNSDHKEKLFNSNTGITTCTSLLNKIINNYLGYRYNGNIIVPETQSLQSSNFYNENKDLFLDSFQLIYNLDTNRYLYLYTQELYKNINTFTCYICNNLNTRNIPSFTYNSRNVTIDDMVVHIDNVNISNMDFGLVCRLYDNIFSDYHKDPMIQKYKKCMNKISIFSSQLIFSFINDQRKPIDLLKLRSGDIIELQQYLSCTYDISYYKTNTSFIHYSTCLLEIVLSPSENNNWIILDRYSYAPSEKEILIKRNSFLVFNTLKYIYINGINLPVAEFILFSDKTKMLKVSNMKSGTVNLYENPLLSQSYITILEYANETYFGKPYKHAKKIQCKNEPSDFKLFFNDSLEYKSGIWTTYRPLHGLVHAVRVSIWVYIYCLSILKYNYNPEWVKLINPSFILKVCIASIFLVSGRESEQGYRIWNDFEKNCKFIDDNYNRACVDSDGYNILDYKYAHDRYRIASSKNFKDAVLKYPYISDIFHKNELDEFASIILRYYEPTKLNNDKEKLIGFLFKNAHNLDLVRIKNKLTNYLIPIDIKLNSEEFIETNNKFINLSIEMCKLSGDDVYITSYKEDTEQSENFIQGAENSREAKFIDFNNKPKFCVSELLDFINPYIKTLIIDIEENKYQFKPLSPQYQIDQNNIDSVDNVGCSIEPIISLDKFMKQYIKNTVEEILQEKYNGNPVLIGGVKNDKNNSSYDDVEELEQYYKNRTFGNTAYLSKNSELLCYIKMNNINIKTCIILFNKLNEFTNIEVINLLNISILNKLIQHEDEQKEEQIQVSQSPKQKQLYEQIQTLLKQIQISQLPKLNQSDEQIQIQIQTLLKQIQEQPQQILEEILKQLQLQEQPQQIQYNKLIQILQSKDELPLQRKYLKYKNKYLKLKNK